MLTVLSNVLLIALLMTSAYAAVATYLGKTRVEIGILQPGSGLLKESIKFNVTRGEVGERTEAGGSFVLNRVCNVTVSLSSDATSAEFNKLDVRVDLKSSGTATATQTLNGTQNGAEATFLNLAKDTWSVTYVFSYNVTDTATKTSVALEFTWNAY